jgi:hypothetical protein
MTAGTLKQKTTARATAFGWLSIYDPTHRKVRDEWGTRSSVFG